MLLTPLSKVHFAYYSPCLVLYVSVMAPGLCSPHSMFYSLTPTCMLCNTYIILFHPVLFLVLYTVAIPPYHSTHSFPYIIYYWGVPPPFYTLFTLWLHAPCSIVNLLDFRLHWLSSPLFSPYSSAHTLFLYTKYHSLFVLSRMSLTRFCQPFVSLRIVFPNSFLLTYSLYAVTIHHGPLSILLGPHSTLLPV